jgi:anthranilate/para-aminobenzoate synthase component II
LFFVLLYLQSTHTSHVIIICAPPPSNPSLQVAVGRYHSLYATPGDFPAAVLSVTARLVCGPDDPVPDLVLGARRVDAPPCSGVQFHPESILTQPGAGLAMVRNALAEAVAFTDEARGKTAGK